MKCEANVAVVHDVAFTRGGGMRVVEEAARQFDADLYVGMIKKDVCDQSPFDITPLFQCTIEHGTARGLYFLTQFRNVPRLRAYDVVLLSGSGTYWYTPPSDQRVVWYVHSVPLSYTSDDVVSRVSRYLRRSTLSNPDSIVANSEPTRDSIRRYWNKEAAIAFPPVDVDSFDAIAANDGHHIAISRLTADKGVRELVEVYNDCYIELVVVGDGPLLDELRELAAENVRIVGYVSEQEKRTLLSEASALVLNSGNESFGIVPIEAMASGTPVIAKIGGYTPYQIDDGRTGILYEDGKLHAALDRFLDQGISATADELVDAAHKYGLGQFTEQLEDALCPES